mmetsp:Transcript_8267/g.12254  ORF Transcript_8267/g.12254 Transcript_8267/m.12254 type:complete len:91 (+) Transcript_8267:272-544(+)
MNPSNKTSQKKACLKMHRNKRRKSRRRGDQLEKDKSLRGTVLGIQPRVGICSLRLQDKRGVGWRKPNSQLIQSRGTRIESETKSQKVHDY